MQLIDCPKVMVKSSSYETPTRHEANYENGFGNLVGKQWSLDMDVFSLLD